MLSIFDDLGEAPSDLLLVLVAWARELYALHPIITFGLILQSLELNILGLRLDSIRCFGLVMLHEVDYAKSTLAN